MAISTTDNGPVTGSSKEISGLLNIDKPSRWTSHDVVAKVRTVLGVRKVGHTGTLDPMATGVLLLCVGRATKMAQFLMGLEKEYLATMRLGGESDTLDGTGRITITEESPQITADQVDRVFRRFTGRQEQIPPMYSALKHRGQPLYKLARQGKTVERQPRQVSIRSLQLCNFSPPKVSFRVCCSSGTYIRVLAADIGRELGCGAYLIELRRTRLGSFRSEEAMSVEKVVQLAQATEIEKHLAPVRYGLEKFPRFVVNSGGVSRVLQGRPLTAEIFQEMDRRTQMGEVVRIETPEGRLLAMASVLIGADKLSRVSPTDRVCQSLRVLS